MRFSTIPALYFLLFALTSGCSQESAQTSLNTGLGENGPEERSPETSEPADTQPEQATVPEPLPVLPKDAFEEIEWTILIPEMDLIALQNPPEELMNIEDGSEEDVIDGKLGNNMDSLADSAFQQALVSTSIVDEMRGKNLKIPGFIVPLEFNDDQTITEFFLVPYFGACLHLPPPPPNQIIYISYPQGIKVDALYDPFWVYGTLDSGITENSTATSAYRMRMHHFEPYYE